MIAIFQKLWNSKGTSEETMQTINDFNILIFLNTFDQRF